MGESGAPRTPEAILLWATLAVQVVLRALYTLNHRVDSDEPQHLHVAWGWTQGLIPYRDFFDNHAPLFHIMAAPFVRLIGERVEILIYARWLMLPLVGATIWATYWIGQSLWSKRTGLWAGALTGVTPGFLLTSTEFRADDLWMACWMGALAVALTGEMTRRRAFLAGLLLGAAVATSLKSVLLLLALAMAWALTWLPAAGAAKIRRPLVAAMLVGFVAVPAALLALFWRLHALEDLAYCTVGHNVVPGLGLWGSAPMRLLILPAALPLLVLAARILFRGETARRVRQARSVLFLTTGLYVALLESGWPLITRQDYLPWTPMLLLVAVALGERAFDAAAHRWPDVRRWGIGMVAPAAVLAGCLVWVNVREAAWVRSDAREFHLLASVLRLTRPGESIMDSKGETIFRPRPYYYVLEGVTKWRLASGRLPDRIAADVVRARTHFAVTDDRFFPPAAHEFMNHHFVSIGPLRVLGSDLGADGMTAGPRRFDVSYPERFAVLADGRAAAGVLDGTPYCAPRLLEAGAHAYAALPTEHHVWVVWEGALQRGLDADLAGVPR